MPVAMIPGDPPSMITRRQVLKPPSAGFGYLALAGLLGQEAARAADAPRPPRPGRSPRSSRTFPAKAKRIIFLFMNGAMSQMDTWEYKPQLQKDDGKVGPGGGILTALEVQVPAARPDRHLGLRTVTRNLAKHVDKLCFLRGLHTDTPGPSAGGHAAAHRHGASPPLTRPSHGRLAALRPGHREPGSARLHHDQPAAEFRRRGQLRQRVPAGPLPGDADQRHRLPAEPEGRRRARRCSASSST